jgi:pimeloyl-ACP methyl ester carboxylesterase
MSDAGKKTLRIFNGNRRALALSLLCLLVSGCATAPLAPPSLAGAPAGAMVFAADGAGNFQAASRTLRAVSRSAKCPLQVETVNWSHGYGRVVADQLCYTRSRGEGKRLAASVLDYHAQHPGVPIYLVGHSAGSAVVLAALEDLPPGLVDRAVLLSPSVSTGYDLRPALAAVDRGLYVYYSKHDYWYLGFVTGVLGTADRRWTSASGRYGFQVPPEGADASLYSKLYQRSWQPGDMQLGNLGGHYGSYQPEFLRAYIVPLLQPAASLPR